MKICLFTETFHPVIGGGETQARLLADGLVARGDAVVVLTRRSDAAYPAQERLGPIEVRRIAPSGGGTLRKWGLVLTGVPALLRLRASYDLVFVSGFRLLGMPAVLVARQLGKHVVLKADSAGEMSGAYFEAGLARVGLGQRSWLFRAFLRLRNALLRHADAFVAITDDIALELDAAGLEASRIHRIPNAVDTRRFAPVSLSRKRELRQQLGLPDVAPIVAYTGRLVRYKGLPQLVEVWPQIVAAYPDALLLLVGTGGLDIHACEDELRAAVHSHGLERNVRFAGSVQNVHEYLQAADAFAFPTENDAFPSSIIEAMAVALPVVATPVGAIPQVVRDGESGLVVPPGDATALVHALRRVLGDPDLAARLGHRARQVVQDHYSAERVAQRYAELFQQVVGTGQRFGESPHRGP